MKQSSLTRGSSGSNNGNNKNSQYYISVGYWDTDNEDNKVFISLPSIIYLDNLEKRNVSGESEFADTLCKGNDLLEEIRDGAKMNLEPGEKKELQLTVLVCRKKTSAEESHKKVIRGLWG